MIAVLANASRVAAAGWLPWLAAGTLHDVSGWFVFVLCLSMLMLVRKLLNKVYARYQC